MIDANREQVIERTLLALGEAWRRHPSWTLGRLVLHATRPRFAGTDPVEFLQSMLDETLAHRLRRV